MKKNLKKYNKPTFLLTLSSLFLFFLFLLFLPSQNIVFKTSAREFPSQIQKLNFAIPYPAPYPVKIASMSAIPDLSAEAYIILDAKSGVQMFGKNENEKLKIASITKLMTAIVAIQIYKNNDILTVKHNFQDGAIIGLEKNEKIKFSEVLKALLIPSANDAAMAIADNSESNFVYLMNKKAKDIHLENTFFTNPHGFDDGQNHSTVFDLARLGSYVLQFEEIKQIVNMKNANISNINKSKIYQISNVNQLLFTNSSVHGIKTGYTEEAGECLISLFEKNNHELIIVVLKSEDRFNDSEALANFAFSNFIWEEPLKQTL